VMATGLLKTPRLLRLLRVARRIDQYSDYRHSATTTMSSITTTAAAATTTTNTTTTITTTNNNRD